MATTTPANKSPIPAGTSASGKLVPAKATGKKAKDGDGAPSYPLEHHPKPAFFDHRIQMFEELRSQYIEDLKNRPRQTITITMPDGSNRDGQSWETSPMDIARAIAKSLSERVVIAKVDGALWDLERPLEKSCKLELLDFEHPEGGCPYYITTYKH